MNHLVDSNAQLAQWIIRKYLFGWQTFSHREGY